MITATAVALERYKSARGGYPDSLAALLSTSHVYSLPVDPFSGKPLGYRRTAEGYLLYSVGPDRLDQKGEVEYDPYDPVKGRYSEGDILH
jgi:hypothetical protein